MERIRIHMLIFLIIIILCPQVHAPEDGNIKVLVIDTTKLNIKGDNYKMLRQLLISYTGLENPYELLLDWRIEQIKKAIGFKRFLEKGKYNLVIVIDCSEQYYKSLREFMKEYLRLNGSILILPLNENISYAISELGITIRRMAPIANASTTIVAEHEVSKGIWAVGSLKSNLEYALAILSSDFKAIVLSNKSWWGKELPIAAIGELEEGRIAIILPPLYSEQYLDNFILLDNTIRWLLGMKIEREEGVPPPLKSLDEYRKKLIQEIEDLKRRRKKIVESLPEFEQLRKEALNAYRHLGVACAVGFIVGYVVSMLMSILWRRKHERKST